MEVTDLLRRVHAGDSEDRGNAIPMVLAGGRHPGYETRSHFYGIASRVRRQILVGIARSRAAQKRGHGLEVRLSAAALSLSVHTVRRELRFAQAWLRRELAR